MSKKNPRNDKPYVSNYPPLAEWLEKIEARCMTQTRVSGTEDDPRCYIETWMTPQGRFFVLQVHADQHGWNIYTAAQSTAIADEFADAEKRLGL